MIPQNLFVEAIGYLAAAANIFVFVSNTMIPLRIAAIAANALFAAYFFLKGYYPLFALNVFMAPINAFRLHQMRRLILDVRQATRQADGGAFDYEWLRPYMKQLKIPQRRHAPPQRRHFGGGLYYREGRDFPARARRDAQSGRFFGEMGLFTEENRRTATVIAATDVELLCVRYDELLQLAAQNPRIRLLSDEADDAAHAA